jgi:YHS domain-containing protein
MTNVKNRKQLAIKFGCMLFLGLMVLGGCKKKTEPVPAPLPTPEVKAVAAEPAALPSAEQTVCPVMGGTVNKEIFVEYKGKKVYFCCPSCVGEFQKDPEKYISKLPQFN